MAVKNEGAFWAKVREAFKTEGAFLRKLPAEGFAGKGTPDGIFAVRGCPGGVVELKYAPAWPKRAETTVLIDVTPEQWNWLSEYVSHDARGFVLLGVADDWFLLRMFELAMLPIAGASGGVRATQAWLRMLPFRGRLNELRRLPALVAFASPIS